jgi:hypothetical protein
MCFTAFSSFGICDPNWRISSGLPPVSAKGKICSLNCSILGICRISKGSLQGCLQSLQKDTFVLKTSPSQESGANLKDNLWAASNIYINKHLFFTHLHLYTKLRDILRAASSLCKKHLFFKLLHHRNMEDKLEDLLWAASNLCKGNLCSSNFSIIGICRLYWRISSGLPPISA